MKMVLGIVDAARVDALRRVLNEAAVPGYTELPVVEGVGRTGTHAGDRVHPGALVAVFTVVDDEASPALFEKLIQHRDAAGDRITRFFILPVERQG
jgi:nitrogen regulatory protein PII